MFPKKALLSNQSSHYPEHHSMRTIAKIPKLLLDSKNQSFSKNEYRSPFQNPLTGRGLNYKSKATLLNNPTVLHNTKKPTCPVNTSIEEKQKSIRRVLEALQKKKAINRQIQKQETKNPDSHFTQTIQTIGTFFHFSRPKEIKTDQKPFLPKSKGNVNLARQLEFGTIDEVTEKHSNCTEQITHNNPYLTRRVTQKCKIPESYIIQPSQIYKHSLLRNNKKKCKSYPLMYRYAQKYNSPAKRIIKSLPGRFNHSRKPLNIENEFHLENILLSIKHTLPAEQKNSFKNTRLSSIGNRYSIKTECRFSLIERISENNGGKQTIAQVLNKRGNLNGHLNDLINDLSNEQGIKETSIVKNSFIAPNDENYKTPPLKMDCEPVTDEKKEICHKRMDSSLKNNKTNSKNLKTSLIKIKKKANHLLGAVELKRATFLKCDYKRCPEVRKKQDLTKKQKPFFRSLDSKDLIFGLKTLNIDLHRYTEYTQLKSNRNIAKKKMCDSLKKISTLPKLERDVKFSEISISNLVKKKIKSQEHTTPYCLRGIRPNCDQNILKRFRKTVSTSCFIKSQKSIFTTSIKNEQLASAK